MTQDTLHYLQYILPTKCTLTTDKSIATTSQHFKSLYGDIVLHLLWRIGALQQSETYVRKTALNNVIKQISALITLQQKGCFVWEQDGTLKIIPAKKMKPDGFRIYAKQKQTGIINPKIFMVNGTQERAFNNNCIIGMTFQSLIILFDHLLTQVRSIKRDKNFDLNTARLFNIVDATNQLNGFMNALFYRQSYVRGANKTAASKNDIRTIVIEIVQGLGIMSKGAASKNNRDLVREEFKNRTGKELKYTDRTLNNIIIDAAGHPTRTLAS